MAWIKTIGYEDAKGKLKAIYDRVKGPDNNIDNILMAHSLRPHTLEGHMTLYKYVLHHPQNKIPKWLLEAVGTYVSILNECSYCIEHHFQGLRRLVDDDVRSNSMRTAFEAGETQPLLDAGHIDMRDKAALDYAARLTTKPTSITPTHLDEMRAAGLDDGEILEINQVAAYFGYANRTVLGLGINTDGDIVGLSPNDSSDPDNWGHQ
ncbi:MAG: carboxymuconolactone decarboxylase family protein [Kordiimonas sp.]